MENQNNEPNAKAKEPVQRYNAGNVSASVWSNTITVNGQQVSTYSITTQKSYKDRDGNWQHTTTFHVSDLPKVRLVLDLAYKYCVVGVRPDVEDV